MPERGSTRKVSKLKIKNEPVVGRNNFQRVQPGVGAKLTSWLWAGRRKWRPYGVEGDPGRHGRGAARDGWVYTKAM